MDRNFTRRILVFIDRFHWLWLILAAPLLVFPSPKRSLAILVIPALWILHGCINEESQSQKRASVSRPRSSLLTTKNKFLPITPLNISLLVLVIMLLVSLWATYSIEQSLEKISGLVLGLGVCFAIVRESRKTLGWWLSLVVFLVGGLGWALIGFLGTNWQIRFNFLRPLITQIPNLPSGIPGLEAGLQHNAVGGTLLWILPLFLSLSVYASGPWAISNSSSIALPRIFRGVKARLVLRLFLWLSTFFIISVLLLTQSRGTYLAFGITVIVMLLIVLPVRWRWRLLLGLVLTAVMLAVFLFQSNGWEGFISLLGLTGQTGFSLDSLASRLEIWTRAIYGVQDFPFTGMGINTFREVIHVLYPLFTIPPDIDIAHAHNEFLQVALDLGIPGLIAFTSIYIISLWMFVQIWKYPQSGGTTAITPHFLYEQGLRRVMALGLGGGLFGHMLFGMTDAITLGAKPGIFYWMLLGLITGLYKKSKIENIRLKIEN